MTITAPVRPANPSRSSGRAPGPLGRIAEWVVRHRRLVLVFWLVMFVAGGVAAGRVTNRLAANFSLPGQPGYETALKIQHVYGSAGDGEDGILVVTVPSGQTVAADAARIARGFEAVRSADPRLRVIDLGITHDPHFVTNDGTSTFAVLDAPLGKGFAAPHQIALGKSILEHQLAGYKVDLTGLSQLEFGGSSKGPSVLVETVFGGLGALAVLAFVFASFLALVPILVAAVSILSTLLIIYLLTYLTQVSFIVEFLVALVGLGIAIDYSLLIVTRWREERAHGRSSAEAVIAAADTAGRAVVLSGLTVAIGLMALIVLPVPGLRSTGIGGMLIPLVSIIVVNTLLPAMLAGIGPRVDWPRIRREVHASSFWNKWARLVVRRRWWATGAAVAILAIAIVPFFHLTVGETSAAAESKTGGAHNGLAVLTRGGVPVGVLTPMDVLVHASSATAVATEARAVPGIADVVVPSGPTATRDGISDILVIPKNETVNSTTLGAVSALKRALRGKPGVIGIAGFGPIEQDYSHAVFGNFPLMFGLIALVTFLLLARAFRSLLLAFKAVILNLVSLGAAFGLMVWFWQEGHGSSVIFSIPATGAITFWVPLMVFAFLFGLSMDYEVFILTRVREEYDRGGDTNEAVIEGLGRTGRLVTSAALILFLAFASLSSAPDTDIKVLATGLGAGILLDATVVRALLVPALVSLFGRWNWWLPPPLATLLRTRASTGVTLSEEPAIAQQ